ncbi:acyl-CoA dehydrogenase family protein [Mycobacterium sp. CVI_P3]|uniref:Acyl-CoA dehydrogenase family protein n=1 Tax=Mycobacterium pinniadriaticum TaxID=2994102 RepID=A0ABT3SBA5_9MYCO|nr:acyl-CoA dehydrogenase family protein [Mycobacterium pinniadriaticum]MCX2929922.1 acyl-CoA dehydrogenase family protein [Mycobacterium pinniadriaticum]MCX2936429.1 acyl-CoA dehydrogenase family protein [Mycobacterium pinniadriaticum]
MSIDQDIRVTAANAAGGDFGFREELADDLVAKATSVRSLLAGKADEHEQTSELSQEVVDKLTELGIFSMAGPQRIGGLAQSSQSMARVAAEIAKGCPSTAWVYTIYNSCLWFASKLPAGIQAQIFADGIPLICSPQNGIGHLVADGDGFRLTGRWSYATGSHHAAWTMVPVLSPEMAPMLAVMPMSDVQIENTWHVAGMKGTGSDTVVADNVLVPSTMLAAFSDIAVAPPATVAESIRVASDYWVNYPILRAKALGVLVGCAEGLLEVVAAKSGGPIIYSTYAHKSDAPAYHAAIGEAATQILAARRMVENSCARIDDAASEGRVQSVAERTDARGEGALVISLLHSAIERLMDLGGSSGFTTTAAAQRYWRDFAIGARHVIFNSQISYEQVGRHVLGVEPGVVDPEMI